MRGIVSSKGAAQLMQNLPIPEPGQGQVLIKVFATAMNRADTLQRKGAYPPPPGVTDVMGLEIAGKVYKQGPGSNLEVGTNVMALVSGGAFAEYCIADQTSVMKIPANFNMMQAAAVPETFLTAFQLLHQVGHVTARDCLLIHAAGSGVGTAAIQLAKLLGVQTIIATTSANKLGICKDLGATNAFDRHGKWDEEIVKLGKPVDLVLDCIGASYAEQNMKVLNSDARWVLYGLMGGPKTPEALFGKILQKRIALLGSTLRARSVEYKDKLVSDFVEAGALEALSSGRIKPIIDQKHVFSGLEAVNVALDYMETNASIGKITLEVVPSSSGL